MVIGYLLAGILGGLSAVGGALLLDLPLALILCAYPTGGMGGAVALVAVVLILPLPRGFILGDTGHA